MQQLRKNREEKNEINSLHESNSKLGIILYKMLDMSKYYALCKYKADVVDVPWIFLEITGQD